MSVGDLLIYHSPNVGHGTYVRFCLVLSMEQVKEFGQAVDKFDVKYIDLRSCREGIFHNLNPLRTVAKKDKDFRDWFLVKAKIF